MSANRHGWLRWTAPAVLGVVVAVATTLLLEPSSTRKSASTPASSAPPDRRPARASVVAAGGTSQRAAPSWSPRADTNEMADDHAVDEADEVDPFAAMSADETYEDLLEGRARYDDRVRTESIDHAWAPGAEESFTRELDRIAGALASDAGTFSVRDVSCKTTMCLAQLDWTSAVAARRAGEHIALARYGENCAVFLLGPPPAVLDRDDAFQQEVYFDCSAGRG
jgi:hypothetical protein